MLHIFRADPSNVGDWHSPPFKYFELHSNTFVDITDPELTPRRTGGIVILGGGGVGTQWFAEHLARLKSVYSESRLIAWGVGVDEIVTPESVLDPGGEYELIGDWFNGFDEVGIRSHGGNLAEKQGYQWVPCASCMSHLFTEYRGRKPDKLIGVYSHRHVPIKTSPEYQQMDNSGNDFEEKIEFLSRHEFIVTNTYHGVFWATLLGRKVICIPFKSGLFSFKHKPSYSAGEISDEILGNAKSYPDSLEECRNRNVEFHRYLAEKYPEIPYQ
jgi:hypothetical protein